jgi:SAM-dependent methyltransferase
LALRGLTLGAITPWWARLAAKVALAPVPYRVWQRVSLFRHGRMQDISYAKGAFDKHRTFVGELPPSPVLLELGPGDSIGSALLGATIGASRTFLVDIQPFASSDVALYRSMARELERAGHDVPDLTRVEDVDGVLSACRATYLTDGVRSLAAIPDASVDFAWSNTVLQHVLRDEVPLLARELRRILKPAGVASHTIDFTDMLGGSLNHLRVPTRVWESGWIRRSNAYTNRLRRSELLGAFGEAGFEVEVIKEKRWAELPTPRRAMSPPFRRLPTDELLTSHVDVVMRRTGDGSSSSSGGQRG